MDLSAPDLGPRTSILEIRLTPPCDLGAVNYPLRVAVRCSRIWPLRLDHAGSVVAVIAFALLAACSDPNPTSPFLTPTSNEPAGAQLTGWRQVSPGQAHTCGLDADSLAWCWGWNEIGQLGTGAVTESEPHPVPVAGERHWRDVQSGAAHTCGITGANRLFCWGTNYEGELGDGSNVPRSGPVAAATSVRFKQVSPGLSHTCGVSMAGDAYCWGQNAFGQLGDGSRSRRLAPVKVRGNLKFQHVRTGFDFTCGITTGDRAYCWGRNRAGQLGDGTRLTRGRPTQVAGGHTFRLIRTGDFHTCALTPAGKAYCWGSNTFGSVGDGTSLNQRLLPTAVATALRFQSLGLGSNHSCGVQVDKPASCWGFNHDGQLGTGSSEDSHTTPVGVAGGHSWSRINSGVTSDHTCGIATGGTIFCWGGNGRGQLGDGTTESRRVPMPVEDA